MNYDNIIIKKEKYFNIENSVIILEKRKSKKKY